ncbi:MAG: TolB-like 6-bladed beta-propeller domain-containing protein [Muribaculaceae bacterium]|nr:TolB-like 6-bladed beta-propeller domain-containing protein [Muribaculaceae bacterium]
MGLLFFTSCTNTDKRSISNIHYTFNDLDSVAVASFEDIGIAFDTIDMGRTSQMLMPNEHTIAFRDSRCQHQVKIVDLNTGRVHQLVNVGQGPEEMLLVSSISAMGDTVWVGGTMDKKIGIIDLTSPNTPTVEMQAPAESRFNRVTPLPDKTLLCSAASADSIRFFRTGLGDGRTDTIRVFPIESENLNSSLFQGGLALSPDRKHVVATSYFWGAVEIFDATSMERTSLTTGPMEVNAEIKKRDDGMMKMYTQSPMYSVLQDLALTDTGIFTGYIGGCSSQPESMQKQISRIIELGYDGRPLRYYILPEELSVFTVSPDGPTLYGMADSGDGRIGILRAKLHP